MVHYTVYTVLDASFKLISVGFQKIRSALFLEKNMHLQNLSQTHIHDADTQKSGQFRGAAFSSVLLQPPFFWQQDWKGHTLLWVHKIMQINQNLPQNSPSVPLKYMRCTFFLFPREKKNNIKGQRRLKEVGEVNSSARAASKYYSHTWSFHLSCSLCWFSALLV